VSTLPPTNPPYKLRKPIIDNNTIY
jgi:hypothetical protein